MSEPTTLPAEGAAGASDAEMVAAGTVEAATSDERTKAPLEVDAAVADGALADALADDAAALQEDGGNVFRRFTWPSLALAGGLGVLELMRRFQRSHLFMPTRYPTGIWDPSDYDLPFENVWFESEDGVKLHGWWISRPKAQGAIVYCHGNAGSIADRIGVYQLFLRLKVAIFAFDYRGYGRSEGVPSEAGLFCDARAALDWVAQAKEMPPSRIILFGHSLGGAVAIDAALHRAVAGLVVQSSFTDVKDMARHFYPDLPLHLVTRNEFRSIAKVPELPMPKLFIHGTEDGTVPHALGERLHAAAREPKELMLVERAGHNDVARFGGARYLRTLARFRDRVLRD